MGGGDLNSKKSWHPNILKNQERVWKAEQAVAEEKKRIQELQRERQEEREKMELNSLVKKNFSNADDTRLHWMYERPEKTVQNEDYLLGKAIDKSHQTEKAETDAIPAITKRVVGSSMLTVSDDTQVDVARKLREDPLLLIKERERAARAALLNNPLHRRRIAELLRKEQDSKKEKHKKSKSKSQDLDAKLAAKLNALGGDKNVDLASLLESSDSSSDSSAKKEIKKKKKKKKEKIKQKKQKKKEKSEFEESDDSSVNERKHNKKSDGKSREHSSNSKSLTQEKNKIQDYHSTKVLKRNSDQDLSQSNTLTKRSRNDESRERRRSNSHSRTHRHRRSEESNHNSYHNNTQHTQDKNKHETKNSRTKLSDQERAAKLAEMAAAGAQREIERGKRVADQRVADEQVPQSHRGSRRNEARVLPDSIETRIHSNRHYIQRGSRHMDEHFARR